MSNDHTTPRALLAAYKACERPSAATEARIRRALADAEREPPAREAPAPRATPVVWVALAVAAALLLAWMTTPGSGARHVSRDSGELSPFGAPAPGPAVEASPRAVSTPEPLPAAAPAPEAPSAAPSAPAPGARAAKSGERGKRAATGAEAPASSTVLEEMALLQRAQDSLREGRPGEARTLLEQHAERFTRGALTEERQALRVVALCATGEATAGAAARAEFLRDYPQSTYAKRVLAACPEASENSQAH